MARSHLFKDLLGCCFGIPSHEGHRDDRDNDDAKENGNKSAGKENGKRGFDNGNPNLCITCRKVNFDSLFRDNKCSVQKVPWDNHCFKITSHQPGCGCGQELECWTLDSTRLMDLGGLPGRLDSQRPACSFCAFLYRCQVRLNLVPTKEDSSYWEIMPALSLGSILLRAPSAGKGNTPWVVQDTAYFEMRKNNMGGDPDDASMSHQIYRVADSSSKTLTRNKLAGGGLLGRKLDPIWVNFGLIGEWLTLCRSTHSCCEEVDVGSIPGLLVIDCTTGHIVPLPTKENAANRVENYVTLSYLWGTFGTTDGPVVQSINCEGGSGPGLPTQIPLAISDAIRVVKQLGYRYLWVDRYCIPQEDGAAKHIQILNMGRIYSNSILTIIAAAGDGPEYGLPGVSSRSRIAQVGVQINEEISLILYEPPTNHIIDSKWNTRGWTYQGGLLSKRRLVFTDLMVYFQCQEMHGDEVLSLPIPGPGEAFDKFRALSFDNLKDSGKLRMVFPRTSDWKNPLMAWKRISEYGPRELGYDSDALNAISGVMEMYALAMGDSAFKLFCGLPILSIRSWEKYTGYHLDKSRAYSFRTWFEDDHPHGRASKAQEIDGNNLTYSLIYSLTWRHRWGVSPESSPACLEQARRSMFGSWTTAGWRTRNFCPDVIRVFDSGLRIGVQYSDELLLDWEDDNARILDLSRNGKIPLSLKIKGVVMDVHMEWNRRRIYDDSEGWISTWPFEWNKDLFESPRWLFEKEGSDKKSDNELLFLIVGCNHFPSLRETELIGMIIRPVTRMLDGQPHTFYERLDSYTFELDDKQWHQMASLTREMEVRLI
ncbi:heterokaryon incompatibility protein-domain-containing protein [Neurospora tetraspora]|uniref:Heterokaryon incompatibility protein-domain-containing protein n=1 Tax=Neurospora tetraspora TaxID=94610 RepID=A0AAE0JDP3_9PEZI|nr:heterokaryon incompatibility protein-domain-containing protein [Neurospora tetraspora]